MNYLVLLHHHLEELPGDWRAVIAYYLYVSYFYPIVLMILSLETNVHHSTSATSSSTNASTPGQSSNPMSPTITHMNRKSLFTGPNTNHTATNTNNSIDAIKLSPRLEEMMGLKKKAVRFILISLRLIDSLSNRYVTSFAIGITNDGRFPSTQILPSDDY